jgi:hypothetical protein
MLNKNTCTTTNKLENILIYVLVYLVIDVKSRCHCDVMIIHYDELSLMTTV